MKKHLPTLALLSSLAGCGLSTPPQEVKKLDLVNAAVISIRDVADEAQTFMIRLKTPALIETATQVDGKITIDEKQKLQVLKEQDAFVRALKKLDPRAQVLYSTKIVMNSVTVAARPSVLGKINGLPMVRNAAPQALFSSPEAFQLEASRAALKAELDRRNSVAFIGAQEAREKLGLKGQGLRVGIIDTGIDFTHKMMGGSGSVEEFKAIDATQEVASFPNDKVVGGIDLVGDDYSPGSPYVEHRIPKPDKNPLDYNGHGTHVAGTVAGLGDGVTSYDGVAPEAKLYGIKVFGQNSTGDAVVIAALEYAVDPNGDLDPADRLDVVNLSLGGGYGKPSINYAEAAKNVMRAGVSFIAAAGNSGDNPYIVGAPSTAADALSVAAGIDDMLHNVQQDGGLVTVGDQRTVVMAVYAAFSKALAEGETLEGETVFAGLAAEDFSDELKEKLKGKIALIDRGVVTFIDKAKRALDAGAIGVVIANNNPEAPSVAGGSDDALSIPVVMISRADGQVLKAAEAQGKAPRYTFSLEHKFDTPELADTITGFSSRGPRSEDALIKPEIVAPGQQIVSAAAGKGEGVARLNGTSMASPHMAGVAALMKERFSKLSPYDHKHILMSTAKIISDPKGERYPVTAQGAGRVDVMKALQAKLLPSRGAFSLGKLTLNQGLLKEESLTLTNLSDQDVQLKLVEDFTPGLSLVNAAPVTLAAGETKTLKLSFRILPTGTPRANYQGYLKLRSGSEDVAHFPVLAVTHQSSEVKLTGQKREGDKLALGLSNPSTLPGTVLPFHLVGVDKEKPSAGELAAIRSRACDLRSVGYRVRQVKNNEGALEARLEFAAKLYRPVSHWQACDVTVLIDANGDGKADQELVATMGARIPGLAALGASGPVAALLNFPKAQELRSAFEVEQRNTRGESEAEENYVDALEALAASSPFHMTTVTVFGVELKSLKTTAKGELRVKIAALNENENSIMPDDYLGGGKSWLTLPLPAANADMPEGLVLTERSSTSLRLTPQVKRPLVLYVPTNASADTDAQEILVK